MLLRNSVRFVIAVASAASPLQAQTASEDQAHRANANGARLQRLERLADIWGRLSLLHPYGADSSVDWNQTLARAIPIVEGARSAEDLARALNMSLFIPLGDPLAFAQRTGSRPDPSLAGPITPPSATRIGDHATMVDLTDPRAPNGPGFLLQLGRALAKANDDDTLLVDLRWPDAYAGSGPFREYWWTMFLDSIRSTGPTFTRERIGWSDAIPRPNDWYGQAWRAQPSIEVRPVSDDRATVRQAYPSDSVAGLTGLRRPIVILVNNGAVRRYERALRTLSLQGNIATIFQRTGAVPEAAKYGLDDSITVRFHDAVLLDASGALGWRPDMITDQPISDSGRVAAARRALSQHEKNGRSRREPFTYRLAAPSSWPASSGAPTRELRIAGLISLWCVLQRFYPYQDHASINLSRDLSIWIRRVESSSDLRAYYRVLNELLAGLNDGHARAFHPEINFRNGNTIPVKVMRVEGKPIIVEVAPSGQPDSFPLRLGDEILEIDGRTRAQIEASFRPVTSAARDPLGFLWAFDYPLQGPPGSMMELVVRRSGTRLKVRVTRSMRPSESFDTTTVRTLAGGVGYINMRAIGSGVALDAAMDVFERSAPAIILDLRGYLSAVGNLARRVVDRPLSVPRIGGGVVRLTLDQDLETRTLAQYRAPEVTPDAAVRYHKPIIVIIDGRAGSAAESWSLQLQTAPNVTFVGAPTVGTTGAVTFLSLPGGGNARFTGERIVRFDGSTFHGIGIIPNVAAAPSIVGLGRGRDEVLKRALRVAWAKSSRALRAGER